MSSVKDWNYFNRNVQGGLLEGRFMNAAFMLIAAGPPRLAALGISAAGSAASGDVSLDRDDIAFPIGVLQSFNIGQNTQIMRLFEIGSERSYFIRGRTMGQIGLGRIMYHGPSLLRVLYAYLKSETGDVTFEALYDNDAQAKLNTSGQDGSKDEYVVPPGYENLWIDLSSDVFSQPIGLLVMMRDSNGDTVGAFYVEYCMVTNHGLSTDAGGTILSENAALMYERIIPVDIQAVSLIKDSSSVSGIVGSNVVGSAV